MTTTARRGWTLVAPTQTNKATTVNDRIQDIENALDDILTKDLGAGNVTLSSAEWAASGAFHFNGTSTSGRTITVPAVEGTRDITLLDTWTHSASIVRGSTSFTISPGEGVRVQADGTTNGLRVIARGTGSGVASVAYSAITGRKVKIGFSFESALTSSEIFGRYVADEAFTIPASLTGSRVSVGTNPAATQVLTLYKNGSSFATLSIATGGTVTITAASSTSIVAGDVITADGPATAGTAAGVAITLVGTV